MIQRHEVSKCSWKNGVNTLGWPWVATDLQSVKNSVSAKCNIAKCNKMRYAWIILFMHHDKLMKQIFGPLFADMESDWGSGKFFVQVAQWAAAGLEPR